MPSVSYLHLVPEQPPPVLAHTSPFKAVVIVDADVSGEWQALVSEWLVNSRCLYMMT